MINEIHSSFIIKKILFYINDDRKLKLFKYNKKIQNYLDINILNYRRFSGRYIVGETNGKGKEYNYEDNLIYEGEYKNGERNGYGIEFNDDDELIYEGEYLNGKRNGKGKEYYYDNEIKYEGEYKNGKKWNGIEYDYYNKDIKYEIKDGKGYIKKYEELNDKYGPNYYLIFEGEIKNGSKNGKGKEYYSDGTIKFEGEYLNGKKWNGKEHDYKNENIIYELNNGNGFIKEYDLIRGKLIFKGEYANGNKNGKCEEYEYNCYYHDVLGDVKAKKILKEEYLNGIKYGIQEEYYYEKIIDDYQIWNFVYVLKFKYEGEYFKEKKMEKEKSNIILQIYYLKENI